MRSVTDCSPIAIDGEIDPVTTRIVSNGKYAFGHPAEGEDRVASTFAVEQPKPASHGVSGTCEAGRHLFNGNQWWREKITERP